MAAANFTHHGSFSALHSTTSATKHDGRYTAKSAKDDVRSRNALSNSTKAAEIKVGPMTTPACVTSLRFDRFIFLTSIPCSRSTVHRRR